MRPGGDFCVTPIPDFGRTAEAGEIIGIETDIHRIRKASRIRDRNRTSGGSCKTRAHSAAGLRSSEAYGTCASATGDVSLMLISAAIPSSLFDALRTEGTDGCRSIAARERNLRRSTRYGTRRLEGATIDKLVGRKGTAVKNAECRRIDVRIIKRSNK